MTSYFNQKSTSRKISFGFTLVELLVVIAILAMIASIAGPLVLKQFNDAKADTARLQIADLSSGLDLLFLDAGRYPTTAEGLDALLSKPDGMAHWDGPYQKSNVIPKDPWGNDYVYKSPGEHGVFDLLSLGADHLPGGSGNDADVESL